jgi:hypothetical protein
MEKLEKNILEYFSFFDRNPIREQMKVTKPFLNWVSKYMSYSNTDAKKYKVPPSNIVEIAQSFTLNQNYIIYRGMGWGKENIGDVVKNVFRGVVPTMKGHLTIEFPSTISSWSLNQKKAFGSARGFYTLVLKSSISPKQILLDSVNALKMEPKMKEYIAYANEQEIICLPGKFDCEVVQLEQSTNVL